MGAICEASDVARTAPTRAAEISGWDVNGRFFVEMAKIEANETGDISTRLGHCVEEASLVFVRASDSYGAEDSERGLPIAHEVRETSTSDGAGRYRVCFIPCRPRPVRHYGDQKASSRI